MSLINIIGNTISSGFVVVGTTISDFLYYDPDPEFVSNASITNRGTSGTDAVGYSGKSYDFDGVSDFATLIVSATLTYIELWVRPDTTTMAICDFGAGKEIALTTGTVGTTGLGTVSVTVDGVSSTTMVALKWQLLRVTLDSPTAITTLRLGRNDTTFGSGQISDVQINDSTSYLETNQASSTGIFDSVQGVLATNSGCALIESLSGFNYDPDVSEALKNNTGVYFNFDGNLISVDITGDLSSYTSCIIEYEFYTYKNAGLVSRLEGEAAAFFGFFSTLTLGVNSGIGAPTLYVDDVLFTGNSNALRLLVDDDQVHKIRIENANISSWGGISLGYYPVSIYKFSGVYKSFKIDSNSNGTFDNVFNVETWEDTTGSLVSTINGNAHLQQFPEVGIPQSFSKNWNRYSSTSLTGTTSLSGTALTGSGTTFTTELAANDIVRVAGNIARVTSVTDNTNAVVVNITSGSWSAQSTVRLRLGGSDQLLPEDANNAGFDVGGLAIVDPQPKFKLDGASYLEGEVLTINSGDAFKFELDLVLYDLGTAGIIATNRNDANNNYGVVLYISSDNKLNILILAATGGGTRWVKTTTSLTINTSYSLRFQVTDITDINAYKIYIDDVEDTLTVESNANSMTTLDSIALSIGQDSDGASKLNGSITNFKFNYL